MLYLQLHSTAQQSHAAHPYGMPMLPPRSSFPVEAQLRCILVLVTVCTLVLSVTSGRYKRIFMLLPPCFDSPLGSVGGWASCPLHFMSSPIHNVQLCIRTLTGGCP